LASGTLNTDNQTISLVGNNLTITNGNTVTFPATTDSQTLSISGNNLSLTNGGSVDLSGFTNTDSQTVTGIVSGTNLLLKLSNVATETLDLAPFAVDTNTDSQTVTGIVSGTDLLLKLSNVATETLDLSSLTTTPTTLADSDGDTNIVVDNGTDPDTISFTVSNTEHFRMDGYRLEVLNSNNNMAIGLGSLSNVTTGTHNVAVGNNTLSNNTIGTFNTAVGDTALQNNKASQNTALGGIAGSSLNTSNSINNTFLSNRADTTSGTIITNATALGANAVVTTSNTIQLGDTNVTLINTSATVSATAFRGDGSELTNIQFGLDLNNNFLVGTQMNSLSSTLQWYEGRHNFAVFNGALQNNVTGYQNIAIGENALNDNSTGFYNIALGVQAMTENTTGVSNIGLGYQVLYNNKGSYNIGIGSYALSDLILNYRNTGIGNAALSDATGNDNTSVGAWSLDDLVSGSENTALGSYAGDNLNTNNSNKNTFIGYMADTTSGTFISNSTAIGASAIVSTSHTFVMGDENVSKWAFGLPTTNTGNAIQVGDDATNGNGASLTSAGVWTNASSILFKTNFIDLDNEWILSKIKSLNVKKWDYKNTNETHIGPTSEEFIETFGVGNGMDTSHLGTIDVSGVALKGVQALIEKVEDLKTVNSNYQNQLEQQQQMIQTLLSRIEALENQ
jgi:hypothetical protein